MDWRPWARIGHRLGAYFAAGAARAPVGPPDVPRSREPGMIVAVTTTDERSAYHDFTTALVEDFRAHEGKVTSGPFLGRNLLLLTTTGARSGEPRLAPVVYTRDGDRIVIVASKGGAPTHPAWYRNLLANPVVTVELGGETFQARASVAEGADRDRLYAAHAEEHPSFKDYETKTTRVIPVIWLDRIDR
jgi:deazaflavin-dependent oxidoreductase (nitroreductase family)